MQPLLFARLRDVQGMPEDNFTINRARQIGKIISLLWMKNSPLSVVEAMTTGVISDYWNQFCFLTERAIRCLEFQEARKYVI